jgi:hypothetical protein
MPTGLQQKCQALPAKQVQPAFGIARVRLEEVQVVQLAQALVDAPAEAAHGDDVGGSAACVVCMLRRGSWRMRRWEESVVMLPDVGDALAKVGRILVWITEDGGFPGFVVRLRCWGEAVQVPDYAM